jgi:hypothetical protein
MLQFLSCSILDGPASALMRITPKQQKLPKWPRPSWMLQNCVEKAAENIAAKVSEEARAANIAKRRNEIFNYSHVKM